MIGQLPKKLTVNGTEYPINSDFRIGLINMEASNDPELKPNEKVYIMLDSLYGIKNLKRDDYQKAAEQAVWFLDGGKQYQKDIKPAKQLVDWVQDESMIFSAVNKVANKETRDCPYIHWWTWLGYFFEIGDGLFSSVLMIRQKKAKGKKLEKYERDFYSENKEMIDIKTHYTEDEQEEIDNLNKMFD